MAGPPRILEIGVNQFVKDQYPERTTLLWTGGRAPALKRSEYFNCTPRRLFKAMIDVRAGHYDMVVVDLSLRSPWHPRTLLSALGSEPARPLAALSRVFGTNLLRLFSFPVPLVLVDMNDAFILSRHNFFLLDKADLVFKRELPVDRWQILCHSAHSAIPTRRMRRQRRWQERIGKIRPIPLPPWEFAGDSPDPAPFPEKTADLFFSGNLTENSWVRRSGAAELEELTRRGVKVDVPAEELPYEQFRSRLARAWLAWSPSGYGWQCLRTSEAALSLAVPVTNYPTVELHRPLIEGRHIIYYRPEPGGLVEAVETALADKARLKQMAIAAREHVLRHHTPRAVVDYVVECGMAVSTKVKR
jgi:hypothetical protein